jgi:hypothetical protein
MNRQALTGSRPTFNQADSPERVATARELFTE